MTVKDVYTIISHWAPQKWKEAFGDKHDFPLVPLSQLDLIEESYKTMEERYHQCAMYYTMYSPYAEPSDLATHMFKAGAEVATLKKLDPYLPPKGS